MGSGSRRVQPNGFHPNGLLRNEYASVFRPLPNRWAKAEARTAELISRIQPNRPSEKHRNAIASYVQRLIAKCVPCQVFTFGSVPLKTYLPDGDIDLTAFSEDPKLKDKWAVEVRDMLQREEKNVDAEFQVKEVHYIEAEVKIIKCLVDNIVVDISFNQLGGLCTLCFLEEVDHMINQNHIFKRSIILIKAWCYYESRILGAHHGLISTYALEILVLYIFHVFNNSFSGPLEVLYRFLEFFSKFDWGNYCVSLWGPVPLSSLPSMAADPPRKDGEELLLNNMFLNACGTAYSVFPGGKEDQVQPFTSKHFNVIDPLRINNNLGRSVSKGNFYRIRSAFSLGAQQLAKVLECKEEDIVAEVDQFFGNTWDRHGQGYRPDVPILDAFHMRQVDSENGGNLSRHTTREKATNSFACHDPEINQSHCSLYFSSHPGMFPMNQIARTTDAHKDLHAHERQDYSDSTTEAASGWDHQDTQSSSLCKKQHNDRERTCWMNILQNREHPKHLARTYSSPELTNMSSEATSMYRCNVATGRVEDDISKCSTGEPLLQKSSSRHNLNTAFDSNRSVGTSVGASLANSMQSVFSSGNEPTQVRQKGQDFINLMSSSEIQSYGGHLQMPVNLNHSSAGGQPLAPISSPILRYGRQNSDGTVPTNLSDWGTVMHYPDGPYLVPFAQHFNSAGILLDQVEIMKGLNGSLVSEGGYHQEEDDSEFEDFSTATSRLSPASPATTSSSGSSWVKPPKMTNAGKKTINSEWLDYGKPFDHNYDDVDEDGKYRVPSSTAESVSACHNQFPGFGQAEMSYPNSVLPFTPVLISPLNGSQHNTVLPVSFYPAGPPVPFLTMVPVATEKPSLPVAESGDSSDLAKESERLSHTDNFHSMERTASGEHSDECGSDIFTSDFASHWKNLQYARLCQNSQSMHPSFFPHSVLVPQLHMQGRAPSNTQGKPSSESGNIHMVPVSALQPRSSKPAAVSRRYSGENIVGDHRQYSTSKQYGGDYTYDRNEHHGFREANWSGQYSKPRFTGRGQARHQYGRPNIKTDQSDASGFQTDKPWGPFQHNNSKLSPRLSNGRFTPKSAGNGPNNGDRSMVIDEVFPSEDALPPLDMLYPYAQNIGCGSWTELLKFGSVRPEHFVGTGDLPEFSRYRKGTGHELQTYNGDPGPPSLHYASPPRFPSGAGV